MGRSFSTLRLLRLLASSLLLVGALGACGKGVSTDPTDPLPGSDGLPCGNGQIDTALDEECDGTFLGSETCESLGFGPGMLSCDPVMCTYDTSMCEAVSNGAGGNGGGGSGG